MSIHALQWARMLQGRLLAMHEKQPSPPVEARQDTLRIFLAIYGEYDENRFPLCVIPRT